jgi:hypothetical protein
MFVGNGWEPHLNILLLRCWFLAHLAEKGVGYIGLSAGGQTLERFPPIEFLINENWFALLAESGVWIEPAFPRAVRIVLRLACEANYAANHDSAETPRPHRVATDQIPNRLIGF